MAHQPDSNGYVMGTGPVWSGKRKFADQNLPTVPGTCLQAHDMNMCAWEICNVVTDAGLTLAASGSDDNNIGMHQLKDAIFESSAIGTAALTNLAVTDAKIASCSLTKLIAGTLDASIVDGALNKRIILSSEIIQLIQDTGGTYPLSFTTIYPTYTVIRSRNDELDDRWMRLDADGISCESNTLRKVLPHVLSFDGITWEETAPGIWTGEHLTVIPTTRNPIGASFNFRSNDGLETMRTDENHYITFHIDPTGHWLARVRGWDNYSSSDYVERRLFFWHTSTA